MAAMTTGVPFVTPQSFNTMRPGGPSLDQLVANKIGGATRIKLLPTGVVPAGSGNGNALQAIGSWLGPTQLIPAITAPSALFDYLFMAGAPGGMPQNTMAADNLRKVRKSILDGGLGRFATLRASVGTDDKTRIDNHMSSIREVENQVLAVQPQMACTLQPRPADTFNVLHSNIPALAKPNLDLMILALGCDVTRVVNWFWFAMGSGGVTFSWLGHTNTHHNLAHGNALQQMTEINTWFSTQLAYVMSGLDKYTDVGGGSMLDNTLIFGWNQMGNGSAHLAHRAPSR